MKQKFPLEHVLKYDTKEVWIKCNSVTTALGIPSLIKKYYPGYVGRIATQEHLNQLKNQLAN
jgi:hypothetical protein